MEMKIKMPHELKAKVVLWADVSYQDIEKLDKIQSIRDLENALCEILDIDLPDQKRRIVLDLYVKTMLYCRENHFKPEQTSSLLSIIKSIHEVNVETPLNNIELCHTYCIELLLCHSVRRPPFSIDIFNLEEVTFIYKYIYSSYMRHYKLYKYIFTPQVKLDLSLTYSDILNQNVFAGLSDDTTAEDSASSTTEPGVAYKLQHSTNSPGNTSEKIKVVSLEQTCNCSL